MPFIPILRRLRLRLIQRRRGTLRLLAAWVAAMMALHVAAMMLLEGMSFSDAAWLTLITATTVGYGDVSAKTGAGRIATVLLLLVGTIFVLATVASLLFERAAERRDLRARGHYRWRFAMHLLIISTTGQEPVQYLARLVEQLRLDARFRDVPVMLLTHGFDGIGLPPALSALGVVHYSGDGDTFDELVAAGIADAAQLVVLGDPSNAKADAYVFDVVSRARAAGYEDGIVAECMDDRNRARLCTRPGDVALRPARGYPELMARAVIAPGAETLIEELLGAENDECLAVTLGETVTMRWRDLVMRVLDADVGTPIGYRHAGHVHAAPRAGAEISLDTLFVVAPGATRAACASGVRALLLRPS